MGAFEYLSVLISIVLGLGITVLLMGFGRWLERRDGTGPYRPVLAWAAFLLLVHIQTWWTMYDLRVYDDWNFLQFTLVLLQPIVLFLLAIIVFPSREGPQRDLRENFVHNRSWFYGLLIALVVVSLLRETARDGTLPDPWNLAFHGLFLVLAIAGLVAKRERVQSGLAYSTLAIFAGYTILLFFEL